MLYAPASDALKPVTVGNSLFSAKSSLFGARNFPVRCGTGNRSQRTGIAAQMDARTRGKGRNGRRFSTFPCYFPCSEGKPPRLWGFLLPLPACGERAGARGPFHKLRLVVGWR